MERLQVVLADELRVFESEPQRAQLRELGLHLVRGLDKIADHPVADGVEGPLPPRLGEEPEDGHNLFLAMPLPAVVGLPFVGFMERRRARAEGAVEKVLPRSLAHPMRVVVAQCHQNAGLGFGGVRPAADANGQAAFAAQFGELAHHGQVPAVVLNARDAQPRELGQSPQHAGLAHAGLVEQIVEVLVGQGVIEHLAQHAGGLARQVTVHLARGVAELELVQIELGQRGAIEPLPVTTKLRQQHRVVGERRIEQ